MDGVRSTTEIQSANDQECTICLVEISSFDNHDEPIARLSSCPHIFHANCLVKWRMIGSNGDLCPICRVRMTVAEDVVAPVPPSRRRRTAAGNAFVPPSRTSEYDVMQPSWTAGYDFVQPSHTSEYDFVQPCWTAGYDFVQPSHTSEYDFVQPSWTARYDFVQPSRTAGNRSLAQPITRRTAGNWFAQHAARKAGELGRSLTIKMSTVGKFIDELVIGMTRRSLNTLRYCCTRSRCRRTLSTVQYWYTSSSRLEWNMFKVLMLAVCSVLVYYLCYYSIELLIMLLMGVGRLVMGVGRLVMGVGRLLMGVGRLHKNIIYVAEALRNYVMPVTLVINFFGLVYFGYNRRSLPHSALNFRFE